MSTDISKLLREFNENKKDNMDELFHEFFVSKMNEYFYLLNEADPIAASQSVDFQTSMADPSRYTISHNMPNIDDGEMPPYDGTGLQDNANGAEPVDTAMPGMGGSGEEPGAPDMGAGQAGAGPMMRPQTPQG